MFCPTLLLVGECNEIGTEVRTDEGYCHCTDNFLGPTCDNCPVGFEGLNCDLCSTGYIMDKGSCIGKIYYCKVLASKADFLQVDHVMLIIQKLEQIMVSYCLISYDPNSWKYFRYLFMY